MKLLIKTKFLFTACLIAVLMVISGQAALSAFCFTALAEEQTITPATQFHETKIEDDLKSLGINTSVYAKNENAAASVLNVTEYCYSTNTEIASTYYNLYFYVYNPKGEEILQSSNNNIQLDIFFDENGNAVSNVWQHHILYICDYTDNFLFYKFRLLSPTSVLTFANSYAYYNYGARKYSISGITLTYNDTETDNLEQIESTVATSFTYTGFSKGCGNEPESTLACVVNGLETISLDINHTTWRNQFYLNDNRDPIHTTDAISTAVFGLPKRYLEEYQKLSGILAEWYEYKTKPIFVTRDEGAYNNLKNFIGKDVLSNNAGLDFRVFWEQRTHVPSGESTSAYTFYYLNKCFNSKGLKGGSVLGSGNFKQWELEADFKSLNEMFWLFPISEKTGVGYDIYPEVVLQYMKDYTAGLYTLDSEGTPIPKNEDLDETGQFSMDLFEKSVDYGRTMGYNHKLTTVEDLFTIKEQNKNKNFWEILFNYNNVSSTLEVDPFVVIEEIPENMTPEQFESKYYVDDSYGQIREDSSERSLLYDCRKMLEEGIHPVLFRFANTQYYGANAYFDSISNSAFSDSDGYIAQETVFLNFDILSLTFQKDNGDEIIIPVVSNPTNIIAGLISPPGLDVPNEDIWALLKLILGLIILVIIIIICWPILSPILSWFIKIIGTCFKYLFQALWWIITAPLRLFKWLFSDKPKK